MVLTETNLEKIASEDLEALAEADRNGFICGATEDGVAFAGRLRAFMKNNARLEASLDSKGVYDCEGITVTSPDRIDARRFEAIAPKTKALYDFAIDWVPGFYIDPSCSFLFGGCAFCQYPDFFTLFIIRRSFKRNARWLIYNRDELLSHELCHVARIGLESTRYEESFAYRTSASRFRRLMGGMFYSQRDSFLFLGSALLIFLVQVLRTFWFPAVPLAPFMLLCLGIVVWLTVRQALANRRMNRAAAVLGGLFGQDNAWNALFRCTDSEIEQLAALTAPESAAAWLDAQSEHLLRWKIIRKRFGRTT